MPAARIALATAITLTALAAPLAPAVAKALTASQVKSQMLGKTIKTRRFGFAITMRYAPGGTVSASSIAGTTKGTWRQSGNKICTTFPSGPAKGTQCVTFEKLGPGRYRSSAGIRFRVVN